MDIDLLYANLILPLMRLVGFMCVGLLLASFLESLHWTRHVARLAAPLARAGHLRETPAASFTLAFFSPAASNSLLAEAHDRKELTRGELILASLFNSTPAFLLHFPPLFLLVFAFLGPLAFVYMGLNFAAAVLRAAGTIIAGRLMLPKPKAAGTVPEEQKEAGGWRETVGVAVRRFRKRIVKLLMFTVPIYVLFFLLQQAGFFGAAERWMADNAGWFGFLNPKSVSIVVLYLLAEPGAALSAAAALIDGGALASREIVLALLVGNIISTPMRAVRHQFPSYAGYFSPALALRLVAANQLCRAVSLIVVTALYYHYTF